MKFIIHTETNYFLSASIAEQAGRAINDRLLKDVMEYIPVFEKENACSLCGVELGVNRLFFRKASHYSHNSP
jgi:hypothetical protein